MMKPYEKKGILSREIQLISLKGGINSYSLHILRSEDTVPGEEFDRLTRLEISHIDLTDFTLTPFEKEIPSVIYFDRPLRVTQIDDKRYRLTCI